MTFIQLEINHAKYIYIYKCQLLLCILYIELLVEKVSLEMELTVLEVRNTIFGMAPLKALGIDGFHAKFY